MASGACRTLSCIISICIRLTLLACMTCAACVRAHILAGGRGSSATASGAQPRAEATDYLCCGDGLSVAGVGLLIK